MKLAASVEKVSQMIVALSIPKRAQNASRWPSSGRRLTHDASKRQCSAQHAAVPDLEPPFFEVRFAVRIEHFGGLGKELARAGAEKARRWMGQVEPLWL